MIFLLVMCLALPLFAEPLAETQTRFGVITGDVGLLAQGAKDWIEPHEGLPIELGDQIRTGEDGRAEIIPSDNALWVLDPLSELATERMDVNSGIFHLSSGTLLGKVDSARTAGTPQRWEFTLAAAAVAVHGTEFALSFSRKNGAHAAVFEGTVDVEMAETAAGRQPPVAVSAGHEAVAQRARPLQALSRMSPPMQALAARWPAFRRRQRQVQNTWSPYTTVVRTELRRKFVAEPPKSKPKPKPVPRVPGRRRRAPR